MGKVVAKKKPAAAASRSPKAPARKTSAVAYSLWTRPQSDWDYSDDIAEIKISVATGNKKYTPSKALEKKLEPFRTKVRWATLTRSVK